MTVSVNAVTSAYDLRIFSGMRRVADAHRAAIWGYGGSAHIKQKRRALANGALLAVL